MSEGILPITLQDDSMTVKSSEDAHNSSIIKCRLASGDINKKKLSVHDLVQIFEEPVLRKDFGETSRICSGGSPTGKHLGEMWRTFSGKSLWNYPEELSVTISGEPLTGRDSGETLRTLSREPLARKHSGEISRTLAREPLTRKHSGEISRTFFREPLTRSHSGEIPGTLCREPSTRMHSGEISRTLAREPLTRKHYGEISKTASGGSVTTKHTGETSRTLTGGIVIGDPSVKVSKLFSGDPVLRKHSQEKGRAFSVEPVTRKCSWETPRTFCGEPVSRKLSWEMSRTFSRNPMTRKYSGEIESMFSEEPKTRKHSGEASNKILSWAPLNITVTVSATDLSKTAPVHSVIENDEKLYTDSGPGKFSRKSWNSRSWEGAVPRNMLEEKHKDSVSELAVTKTVPMRAEKCFPGNMNNTALSREARSRKTSVVNLPRSSQAETLVIAKYGKTMPVR